MKLYECYKKLYCVLFISLSFSFSFSLSLSLAHFDCDSSRILLMKFNTRETLKFMFHLCNGVRQYDGWQKVHFEYCNAYHVSFKHSFFFSVKLKLIMLDSGHTGSTDEQFINAIFWINLNTLILNDTVVSYIMMEYRFHLKEQFNLKMKLIFFPNISGKKYITFSSIPFEMNGIFSSGFRVIEINWIIWNIEVNWWFNC